MVARAELVRSRTSTDCCKTDYLRTSKCIGNTPVALASTHLDGCDCEDSAGGSFRHFGGLEVVAGRSLTESTLRVGVLAPQMTRFNKTHAGKVMECRNKVIRQIGGGQNGGCYVLGQVASLENPARNSECTCANRDNNGGNESNSVHSSASTADAVDAPLLSSVVRHQLRICEKTPHSISDSHGNRADGNLDEVRREYGTEEYTDDINQPDKRKTTIAKKTTRRQNTRLPAYISRKSVATGQPTLKSFLRSMQERQLPIEEVKLQQEPLPPDG